MENLETIFILRGTRTFKEGVKFRCKRVYFDTTYITFVGDDETSITAHRNDIYADYKLPKNIQPTDQQVVELGRCGIYRPQAFEMVKN